MDTIPTEQLNKNIIVLGLCGNTGKTVISEFVLHQNIMPSILMRISSSYDYRVYEDAPNFANQMETNGSSKLTDSLVDTNTTVILDVAASNYEQFIKYLNDSKVINKKSSKFIVPTTIDRHSIINALETTKDLLKIEGVRPDDITVVFNMINHDDDFEDLAHIKHLTSKLDELGVKHHTDASLKKTPYFDKIINMNSALPSNQMLTHEDIANLNLDALMDECDTYRQSKHLSEEDKLAQRNVLNKITAKRTFESAMINAKDVFKHIMP